MLINEFTDEDYLEPAAGEEVFIAPVDFDKKALTGEFLGLIASEAFDVSSCLAATEAPFGYMGKGALIGKHVRLKEVDSVRYIDTEDNEAFLPMSGCIGVVVGDNHGRVVVLTQDGYFGWLDSALIEVIYVHNIIRNDDDILQAYIH